MYRRIDWKRDKNGVPAKVAAIEYDPNRTARIALLQYVDGEKRYILAPDGLKVGDKVENGPQADIKVGNFLPLADRPTGTLRPANRHRPARGVHGRFLPATQSQSRATSPPASAARASCHCTNRPDRAGKARCTH